MTKSRIVAIGIADVSILSALAFLGPFGSILAVTTLATVGYCLVSGAGFLTVLIIISHITQFGRIDENLIHLAKWGIVGAFFGASILRLIAERRSERLTLDAVESWFLVYLCWAAICSLFAVKPGASFGEVLRASTLIPVYFIARNVLRSTRDMNVVFGALLLTVIVSAAASLSQILDLGVIRVHGLFQNANMLGVFLSFAIPGLVIGRTLVTSRFAKLLFTIGIVIGLISLLMSWSRAAYFSLAVQFVTYLIVANRKRSLAVLVSVVVAGMILVASVPTLRNVAVNSLRLKGGTTHRTTLWKHGMQAFVENPVFGVGYEVPKEYVTGKIMWNSLVEFVLYSNPETRFMPHNTYIYALMSTGLIGLILLIRFYIAMLKRQYQLRRMASSTRDRQIHNVVISLIIGTLAYGLFETSSIFGHGSWANYFWILLGVSEAIALIGGEMGHNSQSTPGNIVTK